MFKSVHFRCDASRNIGGGHVMRCLTLAEAVQNAGANVCFLVSDETKNTIPDLNFENYALREAMCEDQCDLLVVDHYNLDYQYERRARAWVKKILVIDDLANRAHDCDYLLDQTYGRKLHDYEGLVSQECKLLLGADYMLLRPQFSEKRAQSLVRSTGVINSVLIFMGMTDPEDLYLKALRAMEMYENSLKIDVVVGTGKATDFVSTGHDVKFHTNVSDMADLMERADISIGAGGMTSWERCCLGLPTILVEVADNQRMIAAHLHEAGAVYNLGWFENVTEYDIACAMQSFENNPEALMLMSRKASDICDGRGIENVLKAIGV